MSCTVFIENLYLSAQKVSFLALCFCMIFFMATGCEEKPKKIEDCYGDITGRWKLVSVELSFTPPNTQRFFDYSKYNIVYEFNTDSVLTVSGQTEHIDLYRGHGTGEYCFSFVDEDMWGHLREDKDRVYWRTMRISSMINDCYGGLNYSCSFTSDELKIDRSPVDGSIYKFVKLNK